MYAHRQKQKQRVRDVSKPSVWEERLAIQRMTMLARVLLDIDHTQGLCSIYRAENPRAYTTIVVSTYPICCVRALVFSLPYWS